MASILIVDDDRSIIRIFERCFEGTDVAVFSAASLSEGAKGAATIHPDVMVLDIQLPDGSGLTALEEFRRVNPLTPIILVTASGTSDMAIESTRLGAMDFLVKPLDVAKIREVIGQAIRISTRIRSDGARDGHSEHEPSFAVVASGTLLGVCPAMQEVYKAIGRVAAQNINVLVCGESGTGKELIARAIHQHSNRANKKFLAVNCAAIAESLLESELFGHEKGSFTGATGQRIGKFEECDGGTLFLDEVGDMPLVMQSKVLRAIQEKEFQRVGGNVTVYSDVRIIAATNRDLEAMVLREEFRADLSFRLNGYNIALPPLRDRREDIPLLVDHYLRLFNVEVGKAITSVAPETMEMFKRYSWPGNIRELQTVLKHAMLHAIGPTLLPDFLPIELRHAIEEAAPQPRPEPGPAAAWPEPANREHDADARVAAHAGEAGASPRHGDSAFQHFLDEQLHDGTHSLYADSVRYMESILLTQVLRRTDGNQSKAAAILGITRGCLRGKLRLHGIMIRSSVAIAEPGDEGEDAAPPPAPARRERSYALAGAKSS